MYTFAANTTQFCGLKNKINNLLSMFQQISNYLIKNVPINLFEKLVNHNFFFYYFNLILMLKHVEKKFTTAKKTHIYDFSKQKNSQLLKHFKC